MGKRISIKKKKQTKEKKEKGKKNRCRTPALTGRNLETGLGGVNQKKKKERLKIVGRGKKKTMRERDRYRKKTTPSRRRSSDLKGDKSTTKKRGKKCRKIPTKSSHKREEDGEGTKELHKRGSRLHPKGEYRQSKRDRHH